jgi:hypothetical protein
MKTIVFLETVAGEFGAVACTVGGANVESVARWRIVRPTGAPATNVANVETVAWRAGE